MESVTHKPIRVLVANRPRLMRELILATFSDQPDIVIVDEVPEEADIPAGVEKTRPDFVIITQDRFGERPSVCDIVLRQHPKIRIIAIVPRQSLAVYYWSSVNINSRQVEASEEAILGVLRTHGSPLVA
jgi:AmiR/NasT family two-component response regulator